MVIIHTHTHPQLTLGRYGQTQYSFQHRRYKPLDNFCVLRQNHQRLGTDLPSQDEVFLFVVGDGEDVVAVLGHEGLCVGVEVVVDEDGGGVVDAGGLGGVEEVLTAVFGAVAVDVVQGEAGGGLALRAFGWVAGGGLFYGAQPWFYGHELFALLLDNLEVILLGLFFHSLFHGCLRYIDISIHNINISCLFLLIILFLVIPSPPSPANLLPLPTSPAPHLPHNHRLIHPSHTHQILVIKPHPRHMRAMPMELLTHLLRNIRRIPEQPYRLVIVADCQEAVLTVTAH